MNTEHNFTTGNIAGGLIKFALPLLLANVLMAGYNLIDMLVVGRYCGSAGVAAVGNASMICFIISSIGLGITIGGTVLIARARGGGDKAGGELLDNAVAYLLEGGASHCIQALQYVGIQILYGRDIHLGYHAYGAN